MKETDYDAKISETEGKKILLIISKFTSDIPDARIKQKELGSKSNIFYLVNYSDLNTKLTTLATKAELKAAQNKTLKLAAFYLSYFRNKFFLVMMVFKIYFFINQHLIQ